MSEEQPKLIIEGGRVWRVYPDGSKKRVVKGISQHYSSTYNRKMQRQRDTEQ